MAAEQANSGVEDGKGGVRGSVVRRANRFAVAYVMPLNLDDGTYLCY